jgi:hypothetical protein
MGLRNTNLDEARRRVLPNQRFGGRWEAPRPNQPSQVSSHRRHECEQTLVGRGTRTSPSPQWCRWKCHRRPKPLEHHHVQDNSLIAQSRAAMARRMKTAVSLTIHCHWSVNQSLGWMGQTRALASLHSITSSSYTTLATTTHNKKYLAP